jgi:hypothetical protein
VRPVTETTSGAVGAYVPAVRTIVSFPTALETALWS